MVGGLIGRVQIDWMETAPMGIIFAFKLGKKTEARKGEIFVPLSARQYRLAKQHDGKLEDLPLARKRGHQRGEKRVAWLELIKFSRKQN